MSVIVTYPPGGGISDHADLDNLTYSGSGHTGFQPAGDYITVSEVNTISGSLQADIDSKSEVETLLDLTDTPSSYESGKILRSTAIGTEWTTISGAGGVTDHSSLTSLDYANAGHTGFQPAGDYVTTAQLTTASGDIVSQIPSLAGYATEIYVDSAILTASGDIVSQIPSLAGYATETYVDNVITTASGDIVSQIPTDYYTQAEVDALIASASGTTDHSALSNLDYASSGHTGFQPAGDYVTTAQLVTASGDIVSQIPTDYYTTTEVDDLITTASGDIVSQIITDHSNLSNLDYASSGHTGFASTADLQTTSGTLQTQIDGKSDLGHTHDDRYYTETEIDTISGTLQTQIDAKPDTLLELTDTPSSYSDGYYLRSTTSGTEWASGATVSGSGAYTQSEKLAMELEMEFKAANLYCYKEYSYTGSNLTGVTIYTDNTKVTTLFTKTLSYSGTKLTQTVLTRITDAATLTKTYTYTGGKLISVEAT
jgi:hypothetical protein